jgi:hypothetical protein
MQVANLWELLCNTTQVELYVATCVNPQFGVRDKWSSWNAGITLSMSREGPESTVTDQLPPGSCYLLSVLAEKGWSLNGQNVVLLMNEDFSP